MAKEYFIEMVVTKDTILPAHTKPEDFAYRFIDGKRQKVLLVPTSKEFCEEYEKEAERNKKKRQRDSERAAKKGGRYMKPLSLDTVPGLEDFASLEADNEMDLALLRVLYEELVCKIEKKNPTYAQILRLTYERRTLRDMSKILGKTHTTIHEQKQSAIELLQKLYREET